MAVQKMTGIEADLVDRMASVLPCQKPDVVMGKFGIGVNTWLKIRKGQPIRQSVAMRLIARLESEKLV